jgi:hypothetical protein
MNAIQLPLSNLNGVPVEGMPNFIVVSGNNMNCAKGAAAIASATGSVGASQFMRYTVHPPDFKDRGIKYFAIVKRNKNGRNSNT